MDWSLPRCRRVAAISYGYIGRSISNVSSDSASRLLIFRRRAIVSHLVSESSLTRTRSQVLVDEYRHREAPSVNRSDQRSIDRTRMVTAPAYASHNPGVARFPCVPLPLRPNRGLFAPGYGLA